MFSLDPSPPNETPAVAHEPHCRCSELGPPYHREDPPWRPGEPAPIADRRLISVAGRDYCASCALPMVQR